MPMFSYFGFKSIKKSIENGRDILTSPVISCAVWRKTQTPYGKFFSYRADKGDFERGLGIFASGFMEAKSYCGNVFLVAPDPACRICIGTTGWRAEQVFVLYEVESLSDACKEILQAFISGYPQIPDILAEALLFANKAVYSAVIGMDEFPNIVGYTWKWHEFLRNAAAGMPKEVAILRAIQEQPALINEPNSGLILAKALPFMDKNARIDIANFVINKSSYYQTRLAFVMELLACSRDDALPCIFSLVQNDTSYFAQVCKALLASECGVEYFSSLPKNEKTTIVRFWANRYTTSNIRNVLPDIILKHAADFSDNPAAFCSVVLSIGTNVVDDKVWANVLSEIVTSNCSCSLTIRIALATLLIQHYQYVQQVLINLQEYFDAYELSYVLNASMQRMFVSNDTKIALCRNYITSSSSIVAATAARWYIELTGDYAAFSLLSKEAQRAAIEAPWNTEILAQCIPFVDKQVAKIINNKIKEGKNNV